MLHEFLTLHGPDIIARTRAKVAARSSPMPTKEELENGVPLFLEQLVEVLRREHETSARPANPEIGKSASQHGGNQRRAGFTVGQVVHGYGDVCQAVTELAVELDIPISADEFRTLNRCLDDAIAEAVTEYSRAEAGFVAAERTVQMGAFAHELRNLLSNAMLAYEVVKSGSVGIGGSTGAVLGRNLTALRDLIDVSLAQARLDAGLYQRREVSVAQIVEDAALAGAIQATSRGMRLVVTPAELGAIVHVDRQLISAALTNLLQNALKFNRAQGQIVVRTDTVTKPDRVLIEVEDECGGLPPGQAEDLFRPFEQRGADRTGLGLGLTIAREGVQTNGGTLSARNLPGRGCIFTVDLPLLKRRVGPAIDTREGRVPESTGG
jgi:signal transduction histidine kinase